MARARGKVVERGVLARTLVLDAAGLTGLAEDESRAMIHIIRARERDASVVASAATLVEVLRGAPRDAAVHRILKNVEIVPLSCDLGRSAGELLGSSGLPPTAAIDAMVAATAIIQRKPVVILTSDPEDLGALTEGERGIGVIPV